MDIIDRIYYEGAVQNGKIETLGRYFGSILRSNSFINIWTHF